MLRRHSQSHRRKALTRISRQGSDKNGCWLFYRAVAGNEGEAEQEGGEQSCSAASEEAIAMLRVRVMKT